MALCDLILQSLSIQDMLNELESRNLNYTIEKMQEVPYMLILKIADKNHTTIIECGDTYQDTYEKLLGKTLKILRKM